MLYPYRTFTLASPSWLPAVWMAKSSFAPSQLRTEDQSFPLMERSCTDILLPPPAASLFHLSSTLPSCSSSLHENWCDQVLFASHSTAHIISKAGRPAIDTIPISGKEVKLWCPTILDRNSHSPAPRSQSFDDDDPSALAHLLSQRKSTFPDGPDRKPITSVYRVCRRIDLEDSNALLDRMGLHLLPLDSEDLSALLETALLIPTAN